MKIGDRVFIHGYVDEIRKETVIIRNKGGYFGTDKSEVIVSAKDIEPVVRCKDCRHRDLFSCPLADNDFQKDDDFCSWGERKGGEEWEEKECV